MTTTLNAGQSSTEILSVGNALKFSVTNGAGSLIPINQDGTPGTPVPLTGAAVQIGANGVISKYNVVCVSGIITYEIGRDNTGNGSTFADTVAAAIAQLNGANYTQYLGQVGCRSVVADSINTGLFYSIQRRADFLRDDVTSLQAVMGNFYVLTNGDTLPGASRTIQLWLEYPLGTYTAVTFNGAVQGVMADGQARMVSDPISVIPPKGAQFWWHTWQNSSGGIIFTAGVTAYSGLGDAGTVGGGVSTPAVLPAGQGTAGGNPYGPYAVIAPTRRPSILLNHDSRGQGVGLTSNTVPYSGEIAPFLAPYFGFINFARGSLTAQGTAGTGFVKRAEYYIYVSHCVLGVATNDISGTAATAATVLGYRQTIRAAGNAINPNLKWFETTLMPKTTSSDSWATLPAQTVDSNNAQRILFNDAVRSSQPGVAGYFDMADAYESSRNSGILKAPPMVPAAITADGNHCTNVGYPLGRPFVNPAMISR